MKIREEDIKMNQHFWALIDDELAIFIKQSDREGRIEYYICGSWECSFNFDDFVVVKLLDKPEGFEDKEYYYTDVNKLEISQ